jgi:hypothetical protein
MLLLWSLILSQHSAGCHWLFQAPFQVWRSHLEGFGNVVYAWFGCIPVGEGGIGIVLSIVRIFQFILALRLRCNPFALPASIVNKVACLAVSPLSCQLCSDAILALPLPCLCWSGAIVLSPLPCQCYRCIFTAATTAAAAIRLSPCHCFRCTSLASDASSLAILSDADTNVIIIRPRL